MNLLKDVKLLFLPNRCLHCKTIINENVSFLCLDCSLKLEYAHYTQTDDNPIKKIFWGRINLINATTLYIYQKNSPIQSLLKELKYKGLTSFGTYAAKAIISEIDQSPFFNTIDYVIPIPLHPKKERKRGYNQVELFGTTLANYFQVPFVKDALIKTDNNQSQTKQNKDERYKSVKNSFLANKKHDFHQKHILLVDDVLTTGATLISCCKALQKEHTIKISIITIAYAI
ncbi:phosphoribosyltransferase family protein [Wenyingzhuangia sp. 1_MG-2023]|nr:phosphoribosyltransferase family protein [Wenyingzhuangia sp. 1_MG-2023]